MTINRAEARCSTDRLGHQLEHALVIGEIQVSSKRKKPVALDHVNEQLITPGERVVTF